MTDNVDVGGKDGEETMEDEEETEDEGICLSHV
jgi:hypothetical protein